MERWNTVSLDTIWKQYEEAMEELAGTSACDVIAHPDLIKVHGEKPPMNNEFWSAMAEILSESGMSAEISSAGWRKPAAEQYPSGELIARLASRGVPLTTASDAHTLSLVGDQVGRLRTMLVDAGVASVRGFSARVARDVEIR
jgi:histidinol-phosphatase (PHP family)